VETTNYPVEQPPVEGQPPAKSQRPEWVTFAWEVLQTLLMAAVMYFVIDAVLARVQVVNVSMKPTLQPNDRLLVFRYALQVKDVKYGDVVVFHYPNNPTEDYIKRIIGMPGDVVRVADGIVKVNGQELTEPYIAAPPNYHGEWTVPEENFFVLGDNRNQSSDSHEWGFVPYEDIVGKALVIYWPLNHIKLLSQAILVPAGN